jgi:hypothetical protein
MPASTLFVNPYLPHIIVVRNGDYQTQVIPQSKQYEHELRQDIAVIFLLRVSTRTLPKISQRLLGHKIFTGEVSR